MDYIEQVRLIDDREYFRQQKAGVLSDITQDFEGVRRAISIREPLSTPTLILELDFNKCHLLHYMGFHEVLTHSTELGAIRNLGVEGKWDEALSKLDNLESSIKNSWR